MGADDIPDVEKPAGGDIPDVVKKPAGESTGLLADTEEKEVESSTVIGPLWIYVVGLLFICLLTFGSYFTYDTPGALGYGIVCNPDESYCVEQPPKKDKVNYRSELFKSHKLSTDEVKGFKQGTCTGDCWKSDMSIKYALMDLESDNHNHCYCGKPAEKIGTNLTKFGVLHKKDYLKYCNKPCAGNDHGTDSEKMEDSWYCGGEKDGKRYNSLIKYHCPIETIQMRFRQKSLKYTNTMNLTLYSVYSYPNAILALLGGMLVDRIGLRKSTILFLTLICTGEFLFALGIMAREYWLMVLGRTVFGFGGESLTVAQSTYCARWFKNTGYMNLAFGITLSFSRIGSSTTFVLVPLLAAKVSLGWAVWVGMIACGVSLFFATVLALMDLLAEKKNMVESVDSDEPFKPKDLKKFGLEMWLITGLCLTYYVAVFPFNGIAKNYFHQKYNVGMVQAGLFVSIYTFFSAAGSPVIGYTVDRAGRPLLFMALGCGVLIGMYVLMWLTHLSPYILMCLLGLSVTLLGSSLWPAVPYVVDKRVVGSAYGLMTSVQNLGLGLVPQSVGAILDATEGQGLKSYYYCIWLFIGLGGVALIFCFALFTVDKARGGVLMCSISERDARMKEKEAMQSKIDAIN